MRRGEKPQALAIFDRARKVLSHRSALHFGPGIDGSVLLDLTLADRVGNDSDATTMMPAARAAIASWMQSDRKRADPMRSPIPMQVMQYWDKTDPPEDIAELMLRWSDSPGTTYHRFDRRKALGWLDANLGKDWRAALLAARSPAEESDYFRLAWLMLEGGLYVDCDDRLVVDLT